MNQRAYEWNPRPPNIRERIVAGIWLVAFVAAIINYCADWRVLRGYDKWVLAALYLGAFFVLARMPSVTRIAGVRRPLAYWLIIGLSLTSAILWIVVRR
jgi:hypothetical protein